MRKPKEVIEMLTCHFCFYGRKTRTSKQTTYEEFDKEFHTRDEVSEFCNKRHDYWKNLGVWDCSYMVTGDHFIDGREFTTLEWSA